MIFTPDKLTYALSTVAAYGLLCGTVAWQHRRRQQAAQRRVAALLPATPGMPAWWVTYASQTGQAEELALQTAQALHTAGVPVRLAALGELSASDLQEAERLLCVASTYGEGDPPDSAARFAQQVMASARPDLSHLHVGLLALGDRAYAHFCGFGRVLDEWLRARGAQPLFERIEVDKSDPEALRRWRQQLAHLAGTSDLPDWEAPALQPWRLRARQHLNPGSAGEPVFHIELVPQTGQALPDWQAGDLAQVAVPGAEGAPRDYSIASVPQDGAVHLLVRLARRADGSAGLASGWLTQGAALGDAVSMRVRAHAGFRMGDNAQRPLILIGNGTGLAGLRGHIRGRLAAAGALGATPSPRPEGVAPLWLLFGERHARHDAHHRAEIEGFVQQGWLARVDWVFSRDQAERRYVQHALATHADAVRAWVGQGAAIYVCGSLEGMAGAVDRTLQDILGADALQAMAAEGRYRRDVY
ncbi:sulfite reductase subunit alpha [Hydrogenophaga crocea]|uniref:NADPH--hemoprotein reductase n=1 Tax=Hydrogenophaga crocea TaxID=2716225 RepID=A0A6G8IGM4_9BURK|nr:sulfite reductase subunit alpha [Hydrogenophaga crocea]QIM52354.1 oxidoreductase [Hydrogenophaga crocea]